MCAISSIDTTPSINKICLVHINKVGNFATCKCPRFKAVYKDKQCYMTLHRQIGVID